MVLAMDKYSAVRKYLRERMPEHEISDTQATAVRPFCFLLRLDSSN